MRTKTKKQHYVPQFLLRKFSEGVKQKAKIWVLDKQTLRTRQSSTINEAHENRLYEAQNSGGERIEGESLTSFFDDAGAQAIDSILKERRLHDRDSTLEKIIYFIALQMVRTPQQRNNFSRFKDAIISKWGPEVVFESQEKPLGGYTEADIAFGFVASLDVTRDLVPHLDNKMIFLTEAPGDLRFIMSDNPVVLHNHKDYGRRSGLGLSKPGIHVFMPISRKYCLEFVCPEVGLSYFNSPIGRKIMDRQRQGLPCICDDDRVSFVNELQVIQSERWLYAQKKEDFTLPIKILQQEPDLARPRSSRVTGT